VLEGKKSKGMELRKLVSSLILENPKKYTAAFLGMPTQTYANWILNANNWVRFTLPSTTNLQKRVVKKQLTFQLLLNNCFAYYFHANYVRLITCYYL